MSLEILVTCLILATSSVEASGPGPPKQKRLRESDVIDKKTGNSVFKGSSFIHQLEGRSKPTKQAVNVILNDDAIC